MNQSLGDINRRLIAVGLPANLTAQTAAQLKAAAPRDRLLRALDRAEHSNDTGARAYLDRVLREAGLIPAANVEPVPAPEVPEPDPMPPEFYPDEPPATPSAASPVERRRSERSANAAPRPAERPQFHVYGGKAALTFELDETTAGAPTVALDGAHSVGERQYNWSEKIRIQFTTRELPVVAAVLLGILSECSFSNHGPANDKGFSIAWQADRQTFFVKVWQGKGNLRAVPMPREDAFYVAQIVTRAIQQGSPARLDTAGTIACLRALFGRK